MATQRSRRSKRSKQPKKAAPRSRRKARGRGPHEWATEMWKWMVLKAHKEDTSLYDWIVAVHERLRPLLPPGRIEGIEPPPKPPKYP